jgi:hypothetical protein
MSFGRDLANWAMIPSWGEWEGGMVWEIFELNQLKSTPSQLLPVFLGFDMMQICYRWFGPVNILLFFQVLASFFFIVMTTGQELGHW